LQNISVSTGAPDTRLERTKFWLVEQ